MALLQEELNNRNEEENDYANDYSSSSQKKPEKSQEIIEINVTKKLHKCIFEKYAYQYDWITKAWISEEALRMANVILEDLKAEVCNHCIYYYYF